MAARVAGQSTSSGRTGSSLAERAVGGVEIVRWPAERDTVEALRALGRPRLLLVEPGTPPPATTALDEDWIRLPASDDDLRARSAMVAARATLSTPLPSVDGDGRLVYQGKWVALSPIEESLVSALVADFGNVVVLERLATGPGGHVLSANAIRVHVMRLRKRIRPLGIVVRTVHGRGYLIELDAT